MVKLPSGNLGCVRGWFQSHSRYGIWQTVHWHFRFLVSPFSDSLCFRHWLVILFHYILSSLKLISQFKSQENVSQNYVDILASLLGFIGILVLWCLKTWSYSHVGILQLRAYTGFPCQRYTNICQPSYMEYRWKFCGYVHIVIVWLTKKFKLSVCVTYWFSCCRGCI